ncbi:MAG TPA: 2-hydroxychromene-2-carboxylate isomerase [Polyangiaceae bacterium]|jgi:2-hydroxychromene-2-carboxylate isomerase|nr:2-hydroxychromene-2-carboxylate isomerase [Polyangiaceae bacterium]
MATLDFWFELASTYSYLAVSRIGPIAADARVEVRWRPFALGPIFAAAGWNSSPFELYPAKGRYMWRDVAREAERLGLPLRRPSVFPRNTILAARVAVLGVERPWGRRFVRDVMTANFADDRDIASPAVLDEVLAGLDLDGPAIREEAESPARKAALRAATTEAIELGIFGAPTFMVGGEMFWGNDRLERALEWAQASRG